MLPLIAAGAGLATGYLLARSGAPPAGRRVPPGAPKTPRTRVLEAGAALLQRHAALKGFDIYLVGFHPMKDDPDKQFEAHHLCRQVNEDFTECVLFDGGHADAHLVGIEYIISEHLFDQLPEAERPYWHPHNGEILSGQLVAPGIPEAAEHALMADKMNSYGKTWHLWDTGADDPLSRLLPLGEPMLAWSFTRDGEVREWLIAQRDRALGIDTGDKRARRADLVERAHPQAGVDALKGRFPGEGRAIPGVRDRG